MDAESDAALELVNARLDAVTSGVASLANIVNSEWNEHREELDTIGRALDRTNAIARKQLPPILADRKARRENMEGFLAELQLALSKAESAGSIDATGA
jgi:hypothetical protein